MLAAEAGHYDVVELLLQLHADIDERNLVYISLRSVCLSVWARESDSSVLIIYLFIERESSYNSTQ